ncbi:MAG: class I SAM-dependent RNA methyltransferase, partial [Rhodospirillaceae bacterium]
MGWAPNAQARDKRERILKALKRHGFSKGELETKLPETLSLPGQGQRQRLSVGLSSTGAVGFHTRRDTTIVDVPNCLLPVPRLAEDLAGLRRVWHQLAAATSTALPTGTALLTSSDSGTDILMTLAKDPDLAVREALGRFAAERDLARLTLSIDGLQEPLAHRRPVHHRLAGTAITFPPGPFLQPSAIGQSSLIEHVQRALEGLTPGIGLDLFCGLGTFTLPLAAQGWRMQAIDIDPASISHLSQAGVAGLSAQSQNLFSDPLPPDMLSRCDGIVFDPPRAGAALVCETIAALPMASGPKRVVAVSCNPATFARDAKILRQGGWELVWLAPIDQFPWTPHVELVA